MEAAAVDEVARVLEPFQTLILLAVIANLAVMASVVLPPMLGRRGPLPADAAADPPRVGPADAAAVVGDRDLALTDAGVATGAFDRVVRIVSWVFILATTVIVALTGLWKDTQPAIFALLAAAGLFVLIVHDLLPASALGTARFILEGSVAITFATLLVVLTGRDQSPFFFVFPLIVGGAALVVSPRVTFGLAAAASLAYILAIVPPGGGGLPPETVAIVGINITALVLLAYVAMVINREQKRARDAAIRLSTIDPLTGLFNRTFFFAAVEREIARSARSGRGFCLLMMDLDDLKQINDRSGHFFGDRVLRGVGEVIQSGGRRIDTAARYGGDEFVVLLPETDPTGAYVLAEKIRQEVSGLRIPIGGSTIQPSMSIGVVGFPEDGRTVDELLITADASMYRSKRAGKNRVSGVDVPAPDAAMPGASATPVATGAPAAAATADAAASTTTDTEVGEPVMDPAGGPAALSALPEPAPLPAAKTGASSTRSRSRRRGGESV